ncbi:nose resistant to fluoxetine protein 6-like [Spodoptera frugiperda]|uniref:Nose resistant to fluoxetine protein 6-like n=1 Tax=Spodoptera frugiperda TaxID=7108 RepID=A0A9R0DWW6_SPOFR|nr:nose resistant to fluoxetine protein 6-like [Spodoptera frugiperda]
MSYILFVLFLFYGQVYPLAPHKPQADTFLDSLAHKLKLETWERDEVPCLESVLNVLENVKNHTLWADWIWNSNALPTGNLYGSFRHYASYDQCLKPPWLHTHPQMKTKYCFTDFLLSDESDVKTVADYDPLGPTMQFINSPSPSGLPVNHIMWGICIPAVCSSTAVSKLTKVMYESATLSSIASDVTVKHCQEAGESPLYSTGFYTFMVLVLSLIATAVGSTYYRKHVPAAEQSTNYLIKIITKSFCMNNNQEDLTKVNKDEIHVLNGIRFLTSAIVISMHVIFYMSVAGISNLLDVDEFLEGAGGLLLHFDLFVDTFFTMSGLLHIKGLMKRRQSLLGVLWKRYIRLIGPFALIVFYLISVSKHYSPGPAWIGVDETDICEKHWVKSLLMMNSDVRHICHAVTWYLPCDYQLTILGTFLFFLYQRNRSFGFVSYAIVAAFSIVIPGTLTYLYQFPGVLFSEYGKYVIRYRDTWEISLIYTPFYSRASTYLVGVAMGYFMCIYKPGDYRKSVSKKWSIIGVALSFITMAATMSLGYVFKQRQYDPVEAVVIAATNRIFWAAAICCIIGMCEYGTVPIVSEILNWPVFTPLSRLSYGIYMIHPIIVQRHKLAQRSPHTFDTFCMVYDGFAILTMSIGLSYAMWLFVEAPLINITNQLFFNKSNEKEPNKTRDENGIQHQNGVTKNNVSFNKMKLDEGNYENGIQHQNGVTKSKIL